jgi:membrane protein required for colicin V production
MIIDIIFIVLLALAVWKGFSKGLIIAFFSFVGFFIGLIAAIKLSATIAEWLQKEANTEGRWWPLLAFALVMLVAMLLVRLLANFIHKTVHFTMMGWVNRLGGVLFYSLLYLMAYSILLFYISKMGLFSLETMNSSVTYSFLSSMGPKSIDAIGAVIPALKGLFTQLELFFTSVNTKLRS